MNRYIATLALVGLATWQLSATVQAASIYWIGGASGGDMADVNNYAVNSDGTGGAPGSIGANDVIEYLTATGDGNINQSNSLSFGAIHANTNKTNFLFFNGSAGATWTLSGETVGALSNAAFVNDSGQGFNVKANFALDGGGAFVISHNGNSGGEFRGTSIGESNGAASLILEGGGRMDFGNTVSLDISGDVTFTGANTVAKFNKDFDLSDTGGGLIVNPLADGARMNIQGADNTFTVSSLIVKGYSFPAGNYTAPDFNKVTNGGMVPDAVGDLRGNFEGGYSATSDTIVVIGQVPEPATFGLLLISGMMSVCMGRKR